MAVDKMSVSFDADLARGIRESAGKAGMAVSTWLAEAAAERLRQEALGAAVETWQSRFGSLEADELVRASSLLGPQEAPVPSAGAGPGPSPASHASHFPETGNAREDR